MEIFITDLAAYNNGYLIGEWLSLPMDEDELKTKIDEILTIGAEACGDDEHEEIFLTDYECDYLEIAEFDNPFKLNEMAEQADGLNDHKLKMVRFLLRNGLVNNFEEALEKYEDVIIHEDSTMEDVAYEFVNDCYNLNDLPSIIANNIDYESIGREMEMDGRYFEEDGDIYEYLG
ncbi:antirestriction protein ArdA [Sulfuricurvum sp.]|uniref:antirestriction protein ArdA n=1 Tax=Sulfuricurvum sp. TaxID=2025608 RepID=UPI002D2CED91|nr:antirestriction protein ArdA [Sulfuricurvum sp.]HZF70935.1 antirestriction protein ArdA [Sulfuricurvum sp.]